MKKKTMLFALASGTMACFTAEEPTAETNGQVESVESTEGGKGQ